MKIEKNGKILKIFDFYMNLVFSYIPENPKFWNNRFWQNMELSSMTLIFTWILPKAIFVKKPKFWNYRFWQNVELSSMTLIFTWILRKAIFVENPKFWNHRFWQNISTWALWIVFSHEYCLKLYSWKNQNFEIIVFENIFRFELFDFDFHMNIAFSYIRGKTKM